MKPSRKIPEKVKNALLNEAGGKCANPGCPTPRVEYHHIAEWAVVRSHNQKDMIAICPTCHDAAHYGKLKITEKTLYDWKNILRSKEQFRTNIFIEPGTDSKVMLGSVGFAQAKPSNTILFSLSPEQYLEFEVKDDFLNISTQITDRDGNVLIRVTNNNITAKSGGHVNVERPYPGRFRVTVPTEIFLLPAHALIKMRKLESNYAKDDIVTALDIAVVKPGIVKIEGFWKKENRVVVSSENHLAFIDLHREAPISFRGDGEMACIVYGGPIDEALFKFS